MTPVLVSTTDSTTKLTLNRPERLNAVSVEMYEILLNELEEAEENPHVRSVILAGEGRAFCVGADLKDHKSASRTGAERDHYISLGQQVCEQIQKMSTPVIAAVQGYALGAGAEMAVSSDFLIVTRTAQIGFPEVSIGTYVGGGVTHRLPRLVGLRRATDLLIIGNRFDGQQAARWGLAHEATESDDLQTAVARLSQVLASKAPLSMARMKAALRRADSLDEALAREAKDLSGLMSTSDWLEGVNAFAEGRDPVFGGS